MGIFCQMKCLSEIFSSDFTCSDDRMYLAKWCASSAVLTHTDDAGMGLRVTFKHLV